MGIIALATAWLAAVIVAIDCMRRLTFPATGRALRGMPSFICHAFWLISLLTSFISALYTEPFKFLRKYKVKKEDFELSMQIVKKCNSKFWH